MTNRSAPPALGALADPTRRAIFERLAVRPSAVGVLARDLPVSRPAVSHAPARFPTFAPRDKGGGRQESSRSRMRDLRRRLLPRRTNHSRVRKTEPQPAPTG